MNGTEIIELLQNTQTIHTTLSAIVGSILKWSQSTWVAMLSLFSEN